MALIELKDVSKTFHNGEVELHALKAVDLTLRRGELVAIMGASGSGKSTMLNIVGTLDRPSKGQYRFDGEPVESLSEPALAHLRNRKMGFVFQQFHLLARERALENVELPMVYARIPRPERRRRAQEALERVGLGERQGQQERVHVRPWSGRRGAARRGR